MFIIQISKYSPLLMRTGTLCSGKDNGVKDKIKCLSKLSVNMEPKSGLTSLSSFQTESESNVARDGTTISTPTSIKQNGPLNNNGLFICCFCYMEANGPK